MPGILRSSSQFETLDKLAIRLKQTASEAFTSVTKPSLKSRLSKLDNGLELAWWRARPKAVGSLVQALNLDPDDVDRYLAADLDCVEFSAFPKLGPLDLKHDDLYSIARPVSVDARRSDSQGLDYWLPGGGAHALRAGANWLHVEDELEFDLLCRRLRAAQRHRIVPPCASSVLINEHLDALRHDGSLIIALTELSSVDDILLLWEHRKRNPWLVVARFPIPEMALAGAPRARTQGSSASRHHAMSGGMRTGASPGSSREEPDSLPTIERWSWTLMPDWRQRMIHWVTARLGSSPALQAAGPWLNRFDPRQHLLSHSDELLLMCQVIHQNPEVIHRSPRDIEASDLLRGDMLPRPGPRPILEELVRLRWERWDLPWSGPLSESQWRSLCKGRTRFSTLRTTALVDRGGQRYDFIYPVWARLHLRDQLIRNMASSPTSTWAPACFDDTRRALVDLALDMLPDQALFEVARRLPPRRNAPPGLDIGPAEALFVAAGRRLAQTPGAKTHYQAMRHVCEYVVSQLEADQRLARPWTRPIGTPEQKYEWLLACWAWSLHVPRPFETRALPAWQFPGWHENSAFERFPEWLVPRATPDRRERVQEQAPSWKLFLSVVEQWTSGLDALPHFAFTPSFLAGALLGNAATRGQPADWSCWSSLLASAPAQEVFLDRLANAADTPDEETAMRLWPSLVRYQRSLEEQATGRWYARPALASCDERSPHHSAIVGWIAARLERRMDEALNELDTEDYTFLERYPDWLPARFRLRILQRLAARLPLSKQERPLLPDGFFDPYGRETVPAVGGFLSDAFFGATAATVLWRWGPDDAALRLDNDMEDEALRNLVWCSPLDRLEAVLPVLQQSPGLLGDASQRSAWIQQRLPHAGPHAAALLALANGPAA